MKAVRSFHVRPVVPERLRRLEVLAYNLRWSWDHETIALFRRLGRDLWEEAGHNPVRLLGLLPQERLEAAAHDEAFLAHLDRVERSLREYLATPSTWYRKAHGHQEQPLAAYFSMEFGLSECLPIYSGGLGILAADHLKASSDLGIPLVGVGILYQKGYFRQYLNPDGWQQERYPINDFHTLPLLPIRDGTGSPLRVVVDIAGRAVQIQLWKAQVGRVMLVLLDTNLPENPEDLQDITDELYGGDIETRIRQEIVLGVGGVRAVKLLKLTPSVYHMNEGHCAFLTLERMRRFIKEYQLTFTQARELVAGSSVFTTHTPIPAGIDVFPPDLMERYFATLRGELGLSREAFLALGRFRESNPNEPFNMAVLALRMSCAVNGVSRLHGHVARDMWQDLWPGVPVQELPINHITNGVHPSSWISHDMLSLYDRYLEPGWSEESAGTDAWQHVVHTPGEELWRTHERRRERLVAFTRRRLVEQLQQRGASHSEIEEAENVLDPRALTIGFARRFAPYKRATLLLKDKDRLAAILNNPERPAQIIYSGKAHPRDQDGKTFIKEIVQTARLPQFRRRIVFIEDYDAVITRYLVQGADVWLNTPRRRMEASGTSGMKAAFNGALNLSIPDGWWDEAHSPRTGWTIGRGEQYPDNETQDRVEAGILYDILEKDVVPLFYERSADGLPRQWIALMKTAMSDLCPVFSTNRMMQEYVAKAYHPARDRRARLEADAYRRARELADWRAKVSRSWSETRIVRVEVDAPDELLVGGEFDVRAWVRPGVLRPDELAVQVIMGRVDDKEEVVDPQIFPMQIHEAAVGDEVRFGARVTCRASGRIGVTVRVMPRHEDLVHPFDTMRILWAQ
ncbi:MAG: alpha-glucan family phosphorylase [Planctomycetota bacterium]